jgi:hypothetical protein
MLRFFMPGGETGCQENTDIKFFLAAQLAATICQSCKVEMEWPRFKDGVVDLPRFRVLVDRRRG